MKATLERKDLLYPELSYKIIGCAFEVYNEIGPGHLEKVYQKALAIAFNKKGLAYREQISYTVSFSGEKVRRGYADFLIEEKIVVEIKRGNFYLSKELEQISGYLKTSHLQLGIIIRFTPSGVRSKRVVNIYPEAHIPSHNS
jgi:GxxExxY protein